MRTPISHPLNVTYLVVGLVFLGIAGSWALRTSGAVDTRQLGWLLPLILVAAGAVGLAGFGAKSLGGGRTGDRSDDVDGPTGDPTRDPSDTPTDTRADRPTDTPGDPR
jgi:hypothetical protein